MLTTRIFIGLAIFRAACRLQSTKRSSKLLMVTLQLRLLVELFCEFYVCRTLLRYALGGLTWTYSSSDLCRRSCKWAIYSYIYPYIEHLRQVNTGNFLPDHARPSQSTQRLCSFLLDMQRLITRMLAKCQRKQTLHITCLSFFF